MMLRAALFVMLVCAASAQTSVSPPLIGVFRDCAGQSRRVFGVGGAFVVGPPEPAEVLPANPAVAQLDGRTLILHRPDGSENRVLLPAPAAGLQRIGAGWLAALPFAIQLTVDGARIYRLPLKACSAGTQAGASR